MSGFAIAREDGRSDAQVVIDVVTGGEPGQIYTYGELATALSAESARQYTVADVRSAVGRACVRLLKEQARALFNVRGVGYRLAQASEHQRLAVGRKRRADVQLRRGLLTLQHVRLEEMEPQARAIHEGTMMVMSAMWTNQQAMERRLSRTEDAIRRLQGGK